MKNYLSVEISRTVSQQIMWVRKLKVEYKLALQEKSQGSILPYYYKTINNLTRINWLNTRLIDWAQKMLCIIVPNRRRVSPEFFSRVRTRQLLSRHTYPVRSPSLCVQGKLLFSTFPTRDEGTTDESKKRLGCYQQEQLNLPREYSVFDGSQWEKQGRTTTLHVHHAFLYISLPSTARLPVEMTNFSFCEGRKQAMTKSILFMNLDMVDRNSASEEFACICDKVGELE